MRQFAVAAMATALVAITGCASQSTNAPAGHSSNAAQGDQSASKAEQPGFARWCMLGQVTDEMGRPLADVKIVAHCGAGTLRQTGSARTDAQGNYELWFGPGVLFMQDHCGLQASTISTHKSGWVEKQLNWPGDWLMANRPCDEAELKVWGDHPVILPDQPQRVNFVMIPAATIAGRLLNDTGEPMGGNTVAINAEKLPPSSSVLAFTKTDAYGRFTFDSVPPGALWFEVTTPENRMKDVRTEDIRLEPRQNGNYELVYSSGAEPRVSVRPAGKDR